MADLEKRVFAAMDSAEANGYDQRHGWTVEQIATDIGTYSSDLEGLPVEVLVPHVQAWLDREPGHDPEALPFGLSEK